MPTAAEILKDKLDAFDRVPDDWARRIKRFQPSLLARLTRLTSELDLIDGNVAMTAANLRRIETIMAEMRRFLTTGEYLELATAFSSEFVSQTGRTVAYFGSIIESEYVVTEFAATLNQVNRALAVEAVIGNAALDQMILNDVRSTLINAVGANARYTETLEALQTISVGNAEVEGQLLRYSRQIVSDTFATSDRVFTKLVGDDLGLQFYRYLGGRMDTTRCFCNERNGKWFHKREIEMWGLGEGLGKCNTGKGWAGMMKGTNQETIFVMAGGYNCQHSILPVSTFAVPIDVGKRAYELGYFKPTRTEAEYFKIAA